MVTRSTPWENGTPNWVDIGFDEKDIPAAKEFYGKLFGWTFIDNGPESGGYMTVQVKGKAAVGFGPKMNPQQPTFWITYFATSDVDATANAVPDAGGKVWMPPMDVMKVGRMAIASDAVDAPIGFWQPGTHIGFEIANEAGAVCWNELHTSDYEKALEFYRRLFGYTYDDSNSADFKYSTFKVPGSDENKGAIMHDTMKPAGAPNSWLVWFAVTDIDATIKTASDLGASTLMPLMESPFGRMAVLSGKWGETFGLIELPA